MEMSNEAVLGGGLLQCGLRRLEASAPVCGAVGRASSQCDVRSKRIRTDCLVLC